MEALNLYDMKLLAYSARYMYVDLARSSYQIIGAKK